MAITDRRQSNFRALALALSDINGPLQEPTPLIVQCALDDVDLAGVLRTGKIGNTAYLVTRGWRPKVLLRGGSEAGLRGQIDPDKAGCCKTIGPSHGCSFDL
jgi:hypothetical protein